MEHDLQSLDDETLLAQCRHTEDDAFVRRVVSLLAERHHRALVRYLATWLPSVEEAEDVAQHAFVRLYRHARNYRPETAKVRTWLYRIAQNLGRNALRDRARRPQLALESQGLERGERLADPRLHSPLEQLARADLRKHVRRAVDRLPEPFRATLLLCDLEGLSYRECAEVLEVPLGTVRSRLFRARTQLERLLEPVLERERKR